MDKFQIGEYVVCISYVQKVPLNTCVCEECAGSGILDFGFYTRKCMKCFKE